MAKQGFHKYERTFGCATFYKRCGKYFFRKRSSLDGRRVKTSKEFANTRTSARRLGIASCVAASVYRQLPEAWRLYDIYRKFVSMATRLQKDGKSVTEIRPMLEQQLYDWGYRKEIEYPVIKPSIKFKVEGLRGKKQEPRDKEQESRDKKQGACVKAQDTSVKTQARRYKVQGLRLPRLKGYKVEVERAGFNPHTEMCVGASLSINKVKIQYKDSRILISKLRCFRRSIIPRGAIDPIIKISSKSKLNLTYKTKEGELWYEESG